MKVDPELEQKVLQHVGGENYRPVKPRVLAKQLKLSDDEFRELKRTVKSLVKRGELSYGSSHLVQKGTGRPPEKKSSPLVVSGRYQKTARGFGFVILDAPAPSDGTSLKTKQDDIHIPAEKTLDASDGDIVQVKVSHRRGFKGGLRGRIVEVLKRRATHFVGTYRPRDGFGYVHVDNNVFNEAIYVGDVGAKSCNRGDKVVIEMLQFPSPRHEGEAVISEVLGDRSEPGVDTMMVMRQYDFPEKFEEDVVDAARKEVDQFDSTTFEGRVDFTEEMVVTIDPKDARDFDDAISLKKNEQGNWVLGVHIADVSHFVRPNTALDNEAYKRATSVYLPDRVVPMLPELISNGLASLQPEKIRYALSVFIEFTPEGVRTSTEFKKTAIKSKRRFTYEEIDQFLERPIVWKKKLPEETFLIVQRMYELAMVLRNRRLDRGAIELTLPEVKIDLSRTGKVTGAHRQIQTESHQIIEEFMLAANVAVAEQLGDDGYLFVRRIHESPEPRKLKQLTSFVHDLGIECESLESRFEVKKVVESVKGRPENYAVNYAILRSMQKAIYSPAELGHYALNCDSYCHFTSPIRRYPDLVIHRMVSALCEGNKPTIDQSRLIEISRHCSEREQIAERAERDLVKLKLLNFLSDKIGEELDGVITGVERYGFFAQGVELPADGLVPLESLGDDHYHYDADFHCLTGNRNGNQYRLGDLVRLVVAKVDLDRRSLDFRVAGKRDPKSSSHGNQKTKWDANKSLKTKSKGKKKTAPGKKPAAKKRATSKGPRQKSKKKR